MELCAIDRTTLAGRRHAHTQGHHNLNIEGSGPVSITGAMVKVNSGGGGGGGSASPKSPDKPEELPKFKKKVGDDLGKKR
jgi:hypothetical protein